VRTRTLELSLHCRNEVPTTHFFLVCDEPGKNGLATRHKKKYYLPGFPGSCFMRGENMMVRIRDLIDSFVWIIRYPIGAIIIR